MKFVFLIDDKKFVVHSSDNSTAMVKMNREVLDKLGKDGAWFGNEEIPSLPVNTFKFVKGNFYD